MFADRKLVIATMHGKEVVIAPRLTRALGVYCEIPLGLNTDSLGTFTGEIGRNLDPLSTARSKCMMAMKISGADLAVASEGSFGPHPEMFFASANDEIILFLDKKNDLEIIGRKLSLNTNFDGALIKSIEELQEFAERSKFPEHALILRKSKEDFSVIKKGIKDKQLLEKEAIHLLSMNTTLWVETDMRAMNNPTRMMVIGDATDNLIEHIQSRCPKCSTPGFSVNNTISGLPCELCFQPTRSVAFLSYLCKKCGLEENKPRKDRKKMEDPMYCDFCNP